VSRTLSGKNVFSDLFTRNPSLPSFLASLCIQRYTLQLTANASESQVFFEYEIPFWAIGLFFKGEMAVSFRECIKISIIK